MKSLNLSILILVVIFFSCGEGSKNGENSNGKNGKLKVASVNYPLHYFAGVIGGDLVETNLPIPEDVDPAYWNPDEKALSQFQSADLILLNGAGYAKWVSKVSLSSSKMVNTSKTFEDDYIDLEEKTLHSHGPGGEHEHEGFAFTTWLNFNNGIRQAESIKNELVEKIPNGKSKLTSNYRDLQYKLSLLDKKMVEVSAKLRGHTIFASHPVYQYLADAYNLKIVNFHWEPGEMPDNAEWSKFTNKLLSTPSKIMIWEDQPIPKVEDKLAKLGIKVLVFNPCGNKPNGGDFISVMNNNIMRLGQTVQ